MIKSEMHNHQKKKRKKKRQKKGVKLFLGPIKKSLLSRIKYLITFFTRSKYGEKSILSQSNKFQKHQHSLGHQM